MSLLSPCISVCVLDEATGWCLGCGRNIGEIAAWGGYGEDERRRVVSQLPARLSRLRPNEEPVR